jgi:membrane associated rhomboid family serine protease
VFPIRDTVPRERLPVMTWMLILVNAAAFAYELSLSEQELRDLTLLCGVVPRRYFDLEWARELGFPLFDPWPFLTSLFLHGGWVHVIANLWTLWIFGDNVEDRLGSVGFLIFYLACGFSAGTVHLVAHPTSMAPTIGASGAIAGVMGAYLVLFPRARVLTVIPIFIYPWIVEVPAVFFLAVWFLTQLLSGAMSLSVAEAGGVAWWAHIGGFAAGILLLPAFGRRRRRRG